MLPIIFAALLGLVLGRFFKVAALAPAVIVTAIFALYLGWSHAIGGSSVLADVVLATFALQVGYLIGSASAQVNSRPRDFYPPAAPANHVSADL